MHFLDLEKFIQNGHQFVLQHLLEKTGYPYATMMMGKCVLNEDHPQFIGMYIGHRSRDYVIQRVESADCILQLGVFLSDFNSGGFTAKLDAKKSIRVSAEKVEISHRTYLNVTIGDFLEALIGKLRHRDPATMDIHSALNSCLHRRTKEYHATDAKLTVQRLFDRIAHVIPENSIVVADTGTALFSAAETLMPKGTTFMGQLFYGSIGYSVPAALGASRGDPNRPVVLLVGDGSFQVTGQELSSFIRHKAPITTFLLNNDGYTIERLIQDGEYNDIQPWKYHMLPKTLGSTDNNSGFRCETEQQLEQALQQFNPKGGSGQLFEVILDRMDGSAVMKKAAEGMRKENAGEVS